jgi:hypothetical protein
MAKVLPILEKCQNVTKKNIPIKGCPKAGYLNLYKI